MHIFESISGLITFCYNSVYKLLYSNKCNERHKSANHIRGVVTFGFQDDAKEQHILSHYRQYSCTQDLPIAKLCIKTQLPLYVGIDSKTQVSLCLYGYLIIPSHNLISMTLVCGNYWNCISKWLVMINKLMNIIIHECTCNRHVGHKQSLWIKSTTAD